MTILRHRWGRDLVRSRFRNRGVDRARPTADSISPCWAETCPVWWRC